MPESTKTNRISSAWTVADSLCKTLKIIPQATKDLIDKLLLVNNIARRGELQLNPLASSSFVLDQEFFDLN
jgi:hypothetical protein